MNGLCVKMNNKYFDIVSRIAYFFYVLFILSFPRKGNSQGSFIISGVIHEADEWVIKETYLGHRLSGQLLNPAGKETQYGTELGNYADQTDLDGSRGICVKLKKNGSWNKIRCPGPKAERLVENTGTMYVSLSMFHLDTPIFLPMTTYLVLGLIV